MHDIIGEIVLAISDENLLAEDAVGAVIRPLGARAQHAEVGARMRLRQVHRRHPFAADQLVEIGRAQFLAGMLFQRVDGAHGQRRADSKGHGAAVPHFQRSHVEHDRQALPAIFGRRGERVPAALAPAPVEVGPAGRRGHGAVFEDRACLVADAV